MQTRVLMISHAATRAMRTGRFPSDDALESRDVEAARAFGAQRLADLAGHAGLRVVTSPARCARETAVAMGFEPQDAPALADLAFGRWQGRSIKDVVGEDERAFGDWIKSPSLAPHGGESFRDVAERVADWLDSAGDGTVIAVTHAVVMRAALVRVLDMPLGAFARIEIPPLSLVDLRRSSRGWSYWTG
jgi:broad specificity phosphatase PhoE